MIRSIALDEQILYRVLVQGLLDNSWSEVVGMEISVESTNPPVSLLSGRVDQAALHGALRKLYSVGLPLISVSCERE